MFATLKVSAQLTGTQGASGAATTAPGVVEPLKEARHVSFSPTDNAVLCLTGDSIFKLLRYSEGALKTFGYPRTELSNYLSHAWLSDEKLVLGTSHGRLQLFEGSDLKWEFNISETDKSETGVTPAISGTYAVMQYSILSLY